MSSVKVSFLNQVFSKYDIDKSGTLDDAELAKGSLNLLGKDDAQSQAAGALFSTFIQGGKDQKGLFPDFDNDNAVSKSELAKLGAAGGDTAAIETSDFKSVFGDKAVTGGNGIDLDGLKEIAKGNLSKFSQDAPGFENSVNSLIPGGSPVLNGQQEPGFNGQYPDYGPPSFNGQDQSYYPQQPFNGQYPGYGQQQGYSNQGASSLPQGLQTMWNSMMSLWSQFSTMFGTQQ
jgi:hypothetical protein